MTSRAGRLSEGALPSGGWMDATAISDVSTLPCFSCGCNAHVQAFTRKRRTAAETVSSRTSSLTHSVHRTTYTMTCSSFCPCRGGVGSEFSMVIIDCLWLSFRPRERYAGQRLPKLRFQCFPWFASALAPLDASSPAGSKLAGNWQEMTKKLARAHGGSAPNSASSRLWISHV